MTHIKTGDCFVGSCEICNSNRIKELEAGFTSEEEQDYVHNEVTGLHNTADLYRIEAMEAAVRAYTRHRTRSNFTALCELLKSNGE